MDGIIKKCVQYFNDVLGINVVLKELRELNRLQLPFFLIDNYNFYDLVLYERNYILVNPKRKGDITPSSYKKQINLLKQHTNNEIILLLSNIDSFNRKRLIDHNVQFIVPGKQMYIPNIGIDLREHFSNLDSVNDNLRPAAQSIILYLMIKRDHNQYDVDRLHFITKYSKATIRRAFLEFEKNNIGMVDKQNKNKFFKIDENFPAFWQYVKKYCLNPVVQEVFVTEINNNLNLQVAGLSALAEYSMLAPPENPVYAIYKEDWYRLVKVNSIKELIEPIRTESNIKLQVWSYSPNLWNQRNIVDKYSLYLSLKEEQDERIEQALEVMIEEELNG